MPFVIEFPAFLRPEIFTLDLGFSSSRCAGTRWPISPAS
jgi:hypothetical protein